MRYGYFDDANKEYVIDRPDVPVSWTNYLGVKDLCTIDWLQNKIEERAIQDGLNTTNKFSPGYCGWNVIEQHKLFNLLPENFCGITLSESALMRPIKSVSGIIGLGKYVKKMDYQCQICEQENCFYRKKRTI